ncbi:hypothetical protein [Paraliomyxa miuraensis]|uniref:hypothetical protein n=1 Tax=Paraliomyxa miuraensis TaxID=376150 RepID=UPI0022549268|nr:hypothetical protein [Paraliomyxa miuraensis]MCX4246455.1 hypothetical protein [Paraliomyxa miuraensis]
MSFTARTLAAAALTFTTAFGSGCDLIEAFQNEANGGTTLVQLMVTHHATPRDGVFPELLLGEATTFDTDEGWTVSLRAAYVTTAGAVLHECGGESYAFDPFWGPLPEDINEEDLDLLSFASVEVEAGSFCGMSIEYGPYVGDAETTARYAMGEDAAKVRNATFYFEGVARKGDIAIDFELTGHDTISVDLDLGTVMNGGPLRVTADEAFPIDLTLSKTYDRLFDGIDFESVESADLTANIEAVLELETRIAFGTRVEAR